MVLCVFNVDHLDQNPYYFSTIIPVLEESALMIFLIGGSGSRHVWIFSGISTFKELKQIGISQHSRKDRER